MTSAARPRWTLTALLHPTSLMLLATGVLPLIGVLAWGWDAFLVLILYWTETAVIGVWTLVRIAARPEEASGTDVSTVRPGPVSRVLTLAVVMMFAGLFMAVHFFIIWQEFAGGWRDRVHGVGDFLAMLWSTGLWIGVLLLFVGRGASCLLDLVDPTPLRRWFLVRWPDYPGPLLRRASVAPGTALVGFAARIVLMQVAVLVGGFIASRFGPAGAFVPLALLIGIKTYVELALHIAALRGDVAMKQGRPPRVRWTAWVMRKR